VLQSCFVKFEGGLVANLGKPTTIGGVEVERGTQGCRLEG
jgi:hypothetical protein